MLENRRPRHIRDIAHLYISRPQHRTPAPAVSVWVTAEHKRCFPGFHAANLAAALSSKNCPVRLLDRSGLLPNAGYYMSLPPGRYIRWQDDGEALSTGLAGTEVDCSTECSRPLPLGARAPRVELVHLPPISSGDRFRDALRNAGAADGAAGILVVLRDAGQTPAEIPPSLSVQLNPAATFVLRVGESVSGGADEDPSAWGEDSGVIDLGRVADWRGAVGDRVPVVIRTPEASLSQTYRSASEALLFKINDLGRKPHAVRAYRVPAGIGSRERHR